MKGLDLNGFMDGLKDIQQGLDGASDVVNFVFAACDGVTSLSSSGQGFLDGLKEGFSFRRKCAWYPALRGADAFIRDGEFVSFKKLVCEAPCRLDAAFQWGVCQRLGEIAGNPVWDVRTRRGAIAFLGEMYRNDEDWGHQASVKEWILIILVQLSSSGGVQQCECGCKVIRLILIHHIALTEMSTIAMQQMSKYYYCRNLNRTLGPGWKRLSKRLERRIQVPIH